MKIYLNILKLCTINIQSEVTLSYLENFLINYDNINVSLEILNLDFLIMDDLLKFLGIIENYRNDFFF